MGLANADTGDFFAAAAEGRLVLQKCGDCGAVQFPPRHHCATCWEADPDWIDAAGTGTVESFTIVRRAPLPDFADRVPYALVAVTLDEGPRMITGLTGDDALDVAIGDRVAVAFEAGATGDTLPVFRRV